MVDQEKCRLLHETWMEKADSDQDLISELAAMGPAEMEDAFYRELSFGTGGLRGIIGAGTNRMNVYTVAKASQGLADHVNSQRTGCVSIAVSYDSRIKSQLFARTAAGVFAANGIHVFIFPELMPTPCLSFAVRKLHCDAGVMITASHNPSRYNGYKVYGSDGCQITTDAAAAIYDRIRQVDCFEVTATDFEAGLASCMISWIGEEIYTDFIEHVKAESVLFGDRVSRDVGIIYTPLNGTGLKPVMRALSETGYTNITVVSEQEQPDGTFPTCPSPNPEIPEAMALGIKYAKREHADLLLATDPDCDRCGIAVKQQDDYRLLTANETGILLLDYICSQRLKHGTMPEDPVFMKTIVTMDLAERIADSYGVRTINVLTGFKYIGEQLGLLEQEGAEDSFILGFEESYGYLTGSYVRDKDAVNASFLICEMFAYYKTRGISLVDRLNEIWEKYGYCMNTLHSFMFEGAAGSETMSEIMAGLRSGQHSIGGYRVLKLMDYKQGLDGLPKSDVLKYKLENNCSVVIRPSGTEPKMKIYVSVSAKDKKAAETVEKTIMADLKEICRL